MVLFQLYLCCILPSAGRFFSPTVMARTPHLDAFALVGGDLSQSFAMSKSFFKLLLHVCKLKDQLGSQAQVDFSKNSLKFTG